MNQLVETSSTPYRFQPGNKLAAGNKGRGPKELCTQVLISQLNEIDRKTKKAKIHDIIEKLIMLARGYKYKANRDGKSVTVEVQPDLQAILAVIDRVDGKPRQSMDITAQIEVEDVTAARAKLDKIIELKRNETTG